MYSEMSRPTFWEVVTVHCALCPPMVNIPFQLWTDSNHCKAEAVGACPK